MSRDILKYAVAGLAILIVITALVLYWNRGAHVVLRGSIQSVRTQPMDEKSTVMVVDFRFVNPSDYPFVVRTARIYMEDAEGIRHDGTLVSDIYARRLFEYYPLLGQQFNRSLIIQDRVESRESMDRMMCVRFEVPESTVKLRKKLSIRIEDVDGAISEIVEEPRQASP